MGMTMEEGLVTQWLVEPGAAVTKGQEILEFETDKISAAVEAPAAGVLGGIAAQVGDAVAVQGLLAYILEPGEEPPAAPELVPEPAAAPVAAPPTPIDGRLKASPLARRVARDLGVDLGRLSGSGPGGRIIEKDVRAAAGAAPAVSAPGPAAAPAAASVPAGPRAGTTIAMAGTRRVIAQRMTQSLRDSAQVTLVAEADGERFHALRTDLAARHASALGFKLSYNDVLMRICAGALQEHPRVNATLAGDEIRLLDYVNIGLAIEIGQDLVVPNIKHAERKSLTELATELRELVQRVQSEQLSLDDITGGTFTITNLGLYGIDAFTPVINPPEAAILGVGQLRPKASVVDGEVMARMRLTLSLTFDHRIVDGGPAARFLARVKELIEQPYLLL
jgi:pyruvate dehydrogenase E2 component (dihydrolipoamide acetyltransferase)